MTKDLVRRMIELGLLIALIFALVSLLNSAQPDEVVKEELAAPAIESTASVPAYPPPQPTVPSYPPPNNPSPIPPTQIPASPPEICKFDKKEAAEEGVAEEAALEGVQAVDIGAFYTFKEPEVVFKSEYAIGIAQWLPDSERVLIVRELRKEPKQLVEVFNIQTAEVESYGERKPIMINDGSQKPVWLESEQAVAFVDSVPDKQRVLKISDGFEAEQIMKDLASPYLAVSPDGKEMLFFLSTKEDEPVSPISAFVESREFTEIKSMNLPKAPSWYLAEYQMAWHPDGKQIAFYNHYGLYLTDTKEEQLCEIDFGSHDNLKLWALSAKWSPDGRYLAARIAAGKPAVPFIDLAIVDTLTGKQYTFNLGVERNIYAMTWAPNGRDLLLVARNPQVELRHDLYLFNTVTGEAKQILEDYEFISPGSSGVAWAPTGHAIALACPTLMRTESIIDEGRLCIISVEIEQ